MKFSRASLSPPSSGLVIFWISVVGAYFFLFLGDYYSLFSLPFLVILYHGGHEAVHNTLVPREGAFLRQRAFHNLFAGTIAYAPTGHNFLLVRRSHQAHHWCGRLHVRCTIDGGLHTLGLIGHIRYYLLLFGFGYFLHEIAGYLYILVPHKYIPLDIRFIPKRYGWFKYITCQIFVLCLTIIFILKGGIYYLLCKILYGIYWGFTQNVAHYGLEIGESKLSRYAARSYEVSPLLESILFGAVFRHLEHHLFPFIPGARLKNRDVKVQKGKRLGSGPVQKFGELNYLKDFFCQVKGPSNHKVNPKEWLSANDD